MGGLTSKYLEEMMHTPPRNTHVLKSDPRSPSDNITRTPISVTDTPDRTSNGTPTTKTRTLPFDPRSPSTEVVRTPIVVEGKDTHRRPFPLKPSRLADLQTVSSSDDLDPRSPTSRVPRTPLSDQTHKFTNQEIEEERVSGVEEIQEVKKDQNLEETEVESQVSSSSSNDENKIPTELAQKVQALGGSNKRISSNSSNPQSMLQAKQCQAIEAEYSKNQKVIYSQLTKEEEEETPAPSSTQFVETI